MGQSTDAILLYGVPLHEDEDLSYDEGALDMPTGGPRFMRFMGTVEDGVEIVDHCSGECPMHFVAVHGTVTRAYRGRPKVISSVAVNPGWDERLLAFCKKHSLSHLRPGWHLASMWS